MLYRLVVASIIAVVVFLLAAFILGLMGVGQPWPSLLGLLAGVAYFLSGGYPRRV